jgi:hypothetical protein
MLYGIISGAQAGSRVHVFPAPAQLTLSGIAPSIAIPLPLNRQPNAANLLLSSAAPILNIFSLSPNRIPATGSINLSGVAPTAIVKPPPFVLWSSSDKTANITLSNANLTATHTGSTDGGVRANVSHTSGLYYFEVACGATFAGGNAGIGIANASAVLSTAGSTASNIAIAYHSGTMWVNAGSTGTSIGALAGATCCVAVDLTHARIWFRNNGGNWNNSGTANPATNTGGFDLSGFITANTTPVYPLFTSDSASDNCTANFGASSFSFTVPSGFGAWEAPGDIRTIPAAGALALNVFAVAFTQSLPTDNVAGGGGFSVRVAATITRGGTQMRIVYTAASTGTFAVSHASVGKQSATYNTLATPVEFTFSGGGSGFSLSAGQTITSDWVNFTSAAGDVLIITTDLGASPTSKTASSGGSRWFLAATSSYNQASPAGSWSTDSLKSYFTEIDVS